MSNYFYFDANIIIYILEANPSFSSQIKSLLSLMDKEKGVIATSQLTLAECLTHPLKFKNATMAQYYRDFFASKGLKKINVKKAIIEKAAEISAKNNFKLLDALHLASALNMGCSCLGSVYEFRIEFDLVKMSFEAEKLAASIGNTCKSFDKLINSFSPNPFGAQKN